MHHGSADSLRYDERAVISVIVRVAGPIEPLRQWITTQEGLRAREEVRGGMVIEIQSRDEDALRELLRQLVLADIAVIEFQRMQQRGGSFHRHPAPTTGLYHKPAGTACFDLIVILLTQCA